MRSYGIDVCCDDGRMAVNQHGMIKYITVYPAMKIEPVDNNTIFISDQQIKYAKPFAVKNIELNTFCNSCCSAFFLLQL